MNNEFSIQNKITPPSTSSLSAQKRVASFQTHTLSMVDKLSQQNQNLSAKTAHIYATAMQDVMQEMTTLGDYMAKKEGNLSQKEVKELTHLLKKSEINIAKILSRSQRETLRSITHEMMKNDLQSRGALRVIFCYFKYKETALEKMTFGSQRNIHTREGLSEIDLERYEEYSRFEPKHLAKRNGVFKVGEMTWIAPRFTSKEIHAQMESYTAQALSDRERIPITKNMEMDGKTFESKQIPLNTHYDQAKRNILGENRNPFGAIFGNKGLSALNRQEKHLVNGYLSSLDESYKCFRHGILSSKLLKKGSERNEESQNAAKELLNAALIETLEAMNMTLEQAAKSKEPIILNLSSVSLVTPDDIRRYLQKHKSEYTMLKDQIGAYQALESLSSLNVGGLKIQVDVKINSFNFGVNEGAVRSPILMGRERQFQQNQIAWTKMQADLALLIAAAGDTPNNPEILREIHSLESDINMLMQDLHSYIKGGNQYEIGARILNLSNLMTEFAKGNKQAVLEKKLPLVYVAALNCFSGKDRTGVMDCMAKALHVMYLKTGKFPTHDELKNNKDIQEEFKKYLIQFLLESGALEITEINTGAFGYKVTGVAQKAIGVDDDLFTLIQGLSDTVEG